MHYSDLKIYGTKSLTIYASFGFDNGVKFLKLGVVAGGGNTRPLNRWGWYEFKISVYVVLYNFIDSIKWDKKT